MKPILLRQDFDYFTGTISDPQSTIFREKDVEQRFKSPRLKKIMKIFGLKRSDLDYEKPRVEYVFFKKDRSIRVYINQYYIQVQFNGGFWVKERAKEKLLSYLKRIKKEYGIENLKITRIDIASDINLPIDKLIQFRPGYKLVGRSKNMQINDYINPKTFEKQATGFRNTRTQLLVYDKLEEIAKSKPTKKTEFYKNLYKDQEVVSRHEVRLFKDRSKTFQDEILGAETVEELKSGMNKVLDYFFKYYSIEKNKKPARSWSRQKKIVLSGA